MRMLRPVVETVVAQHVEDVAALWGTRHVLLSAPHVRLLHLGRVEQRLAAHLDGLRIAGEQGWSLSEAEQELPSAGAAFAAAVLAIEDKRPDRLQRLLALAQANPDVRKGLLSAFGWVDAAQLRGLVVQLLASSDPFAKWVGIAASAMHRIDPGLMSQRLFEHADPIVRARAFRTAGELGKREFVSLLGASLHDQDPGCRIWAARSAVLAGDRLAAFEFLRAAAMSADAPRWVFRLVLQTLPVADAHVLLKQLAGNPAQARALAEGAGLCGDPTYIPWLIGQMADDKLARLAGESFSMMTGVDLAWQDLERKPPEALETGPNDDPAAADVDMDPDDGLPWPDQARVQAWWAQNGARFARGTRHFMGAPPTRAHCIEVLENGCQRQRIAAAHHLCLLEPGMPLFEWRAPVARQRHELSRLR